MPAPVKKIKSGKEAKPAKASKPKKTAVKKDEPKETQKLRIKVSAYEHKVLDASVKQIVDTALRYDGKFQGPIPLPTEIKKYTVNRSSFIDKNSREQFEMRVHKRLVDILNPTEGTIDSLMSLNLPSGVDVEIKM